MVSRVPSSSNYLLRLLGPGGQRRFDGDFQEIELTRGHVLFEPGTTISYVYFPHDCVTSLVYETSDGATAEMTTIGREGAVGLVAALGSRTALCRYVVQVAGRAARMRPDRIRAAFHDDAAIRQLLLSYVEGLNAELMQTIACNELHSLDARLCRWLLTMQDRIGGDALPLTHESLAIMLGVNRTTLSLKARALRDNGLIDYRRGTVRVLDRDGLERAVCECYAIVRGHYDRVLPGAFG